MKCARLASLRAGRDGSLRTCRVAPGGAAARVVHEVVENRGELAQPFKVGPGQLPHGPVAFRGQADPGNPPVVRVGRPFHQSRGLSAVNELDRALRPQHEVLSEIADRGRLPVPLALDRDEQLMLRGRQARRLRLVFAPPVEAAQGNAEFQQLLKVSLSEPGHYHRLALFESPSLPLRNRRQRPSGIMPGACPVTAP